MCSALSSLASVTLALTVATAARADVDDFGTKLPDRTRLTLAVSFPIPYSVAARSGTAGASSWVPAFTFETRIHHGHHGALMAVGGFPHAEPGLIFAGSPQVTYFDLAYSYVATSSQRLRGTTGAISIEIGPSLGIIGPTYTHGTQDWNTVITGIDVGDHLTLGGRVSTHFDVLFGPFMLGLVLGYRGGVPTIANARDNWEGVLFLDLEAGFAIAR